ncbi:hypothetical protein, partial [Tenuifilum sp.]|uniref:hypothetical protein n=1 Tax=Tenuifilum sp. TaxID=2760880 RepID=UPI00403EA393
MTITLLFSFFVGFTACEKEIPVTPKDKNLDLATAMPQDTFHMATGYLLENFESGSKTSYAGASLTLSSGRWYLNDALIGTSTSDRKNGSKSVRIVKTGKVTMQFDKANGASTVEVYHAKYGG